MAQKCGPLLNTYCKNDAFRPPAVHELLDGLPDLVGRAGRGPVFRIPTGGPEMLFRYYKLILKVMISGLLPAVLATPDGLPALAGRTAEG